MRPELREEYRSILQAHLDGAGEAASLRAYDFARQCLREGLAPDDVVAVHVELAESDRETSAGPHPQDLLLEVIMAFSLSYQQTMRQLEQANEELAELSSFKSRMLSMVAHDMMNHVVATKMVVTSLRRDQAMAKQQPRLESVLLIVDEQEHLIQNLLDLGRIESGRLHMATEKVELNKLVDRAIVKAQSATTTHTFVVSGPTIFVLGDRSKLQQIFDNLVSNAVKYSPQGGPVDIRLELKHDNVTVSIGDRGLGIKPEDLPHLFEPFFRGATGRSDIRGTGLGLAIVQSLVKMHQGSLTVESELGRGSTFACTLPALAPVPAVPLFDTERSVS